METLEMVTGNQKAIREKIFEELYENAFPAVARFVSKMNGSFQDAKDTFQDALVIYYEKLSDPQFTVHTSSEGYLVGIAKHLWISKFNHQKKNISLDAFELAITIPEDYAPSPDNKRILQFLERTGKRCLDLLRAFYYERLPMKDIVSALGYGNERSATVQKYKCLEKIRTTINEKSIEYDDFME